MSWEENAPVPPQVGNRVKEMERKKTRGGFPGEGAVREGAGEKKTNF